MSDISQAKFKCIEYLLLVPATPNKHNRRWHLAFVSIYCSRAFLSLLKDVAKKEENKIPRSPSYSVTNLVPNHRSSEIDQTSLAELIKEKDLDRLLRFGGVGGVASALETDGENGIHGHSEDIAHRQEVFGSNTYSKPPAKSLFYFGWKLLKILPFSSY